MADARKPPFEGREGALIGKGVGGFLALAFHAACNQPTSFPAHRAAEA